jgi:2-polyprenyl-3-methyl-5-hydroxy-6-metoxy-1,4-benzoquinol methylase
MIPSHTSLPECKHHAIAPARVSLAVTRGAVPATPTHFMPGELHAYHDYAQPDPPYQPLPPAARVLDAGCGDGNFTDDIAALGHRCHGIDLSAGGIACARERYPGIESSASSLNDDRRAAFPGVTEFDAIYSVEVIEHLYSPVTFARRAMEALRTGGLLILTTPYWKYAKNLLLAITGRIDRALTALWEGGHIKHRSRSTLTRLLTGAGFEFVAFHGRGRPIPFLWKNMVLVVRKPGA